MKKLFIDNKKSPYFWAFLAIAVISFFLIPLLSRDAGNSGDEDGFQVPQGKNIVNYFKTDGADSTCITFDNLRFYGSSPDVLTQYFNDAFGVEDIHITRHYFFSFFGWLAILMAGLIAYWVGGWRAGVFALLLLLLSPRFLGHSFNNPKDIPFAAAVVTSIYFMLRFFRQFPKVKWHTALFLVLSIALAFSIRAGAFIIYGYFGLFGFIFLIKTYFENKKRLKKAKKISFNDKLPFHYIWRMLLYGVGICFVGLFAGILLWPYALQSPIKHTIESFQAMSHFAITIRQIFEGKFIFGTTNMPWYYSIKWIIISTPVALLIGFLLNFVGAWKDRRQYWFEQTIVLFTCLFPIFWIIYTKANVYGGWRHLLFAFPTMATAAGLGFHYAISWIEAKFSNRKLVINIVSCGVILLMLWHPIRHIVNNHPYEYIYFNEVFGGTEKAYGNYEMDYYYHSTRAASEWVLEHAEPKADGSKTIVSTWHTASVNYFFRKDTADFKVRFVRWNERNNSDWDYAIFAITGIDPDLIKNEKAFPPTNCVHTITVDEKPICLILKRTDRNDLKAYEFSQNRQVDSAIFYYEKALELDPYNNCLLTNLISLQFQKSQLPAAKALIDRLLEICPKGTEGNNFLAYYHYYQKNFDEVLKACKKNMEFSPNFSNAYYMAAEIYLMKGDLKTAEKTLLKMVSASVAEQRTLEMLMTIYQNQGQNQSGALKKALTKMMEAAPNKDVYNIYKDLYDSYFGKK